MYFSPTPRVFKVLTLALNFTLNFDFIMEHKVQIEFLYIKNNVQKNFLRVKNKDHVSFLSFAKFFTFMQDSIKTDFVTICLILSE